MLPEWCLWGLQGHVCGQTRLWSCILSVVGGRPERVTVCVRVCAHVHIGDCSVWLEVGQNV